LIPKEKEKETKMTPLTEKEKAQIRFELKRMKAITERRNQARRDRFMRHSPKPARFLSLQKEMIYKAY
jgi:hypothetical protein